MKIILLAGNASVVENKSAALEKIDSVIWLDHVIGNLKKLKLEIDVVLGKNYSDEILSQSQLIKECDIVFDPNEEDLGDYSNYKAAVHSISSSAIICPIRRKIPDLQVWQGIKNKLYQQPQLDIVRPYCPILGEMVPGEPIGITFNGKVKLIKNRLIQSLNHPLLLEYKFPVLDTSVTVFNAANRQNLPLIA